MTIALIVAIINTFPDEVQVEVATIIKEVARVFQIDVEKILEIMNSLAESCSQILKAFSDWADEVRTALNQVFNKPELYPDAHGTPPKRNGMSWRKRPYNSVCNYHYIPRSPRNLPYMRRAY